MIPNWRHEAIVCIRARLDCEYQSSTTTMGGRPIMHSRWVTLTAWACAALMMTAQTRAATPIAWQTHWSDALFTQAKREHRLVLLDLHAVWCHWCHVMDEKTYSDPQVQALMAKYYVTASVDADEYPDLSSRYGDWGWPATIVLAADGSEIVKRRGYIPAKQMASLLQAIVDDPSPGPSVAPAVVIARGDSRLGGRQRAALTEAYERLYDEQHGAWGDVHKFID